MTETKKVVLATFGTLGDVYPFVAVALALKARGFAPLLVAPERHRRVIEAEGVALHPIRPNEADIAAQLGVTIPGLYGLILRNPHFILDDIFMRFLAETYEDVLGAGEGACLVITQSLLVGAHLAAETLGVPRARLALAPVHLQSAQAPSLTPAVPYVIAPTTRMATRYNTLVRAIVRRVVTRRMGRLRAFRRHLGLAPSREDLFLDFGRPNAAQAIFGLYSPHFAPAQADQPGNLVVPGFPFYQGAAEARRRLDPKLRAFLESGEPPIVFTLGSFATDVAGDFYDRSFRAARGLGRRAVLLAGAADAAGLAPLVAADAADAHVCEQAPHALLFPRSACIVHHGGIGTTAEALRAGKPQLVVPFFGDQADNGARVERLGLGRTIKLADYDEKRATTALRTILAGDVAARAQAFAGMMATDPGVEAVADWAERTAGVAERKQKRPDERAP